MIKIQKIKRILSNAILLGTAFFFMACEGFKFTGTMCESLQPGQALSECQAYDEEAAQKASVPPKDDSGECLKCNEAKELQIRQ